MANDQQQLRAIVQRMLDRGESEDAIREVVRNYNQMPDELVDSHRGPQPTADPGRVALMEAGLSPRLTHSLADGLQGGGVSTPMAIMGQAPRLGVQLARRLYSGLLKPKQGVKDSFGSGSEIAGTLLDERVPITQGGLSRVTSRLGQSRQAALNAVNQAHAQGMQGVRPKQVVSEFGDVVKELRNRADIGQPSELARVGQRGRAIVNTAGRAGGDIPLPRAQALKETAQDAASGAYRTLERGTQKQLSADDLLDTAVARGLRSGIESRVPAVAAHNTRSQSLLGGKRALEDALDRESNTLGVGGAKDMLAMMAGGGAYAAGAGPMAVPLAIGTRLMTTPSTGSMGTILLNEASKSGILDAATRAAIISMMRNRE